MPGNPYLAEDVGELTVASKQDLVKILEEVQYKTVPHPLSPPTFPRKAVDST